MGNVENNDSSAFYSGHALAVRCMFLKSHQLFTPRRSEARNIKENKRIKITKWLVLHVNLAKAGCPVVWTNTSLDAAVKVFFKCN